jgi:hypothetical protein
MEPTLYPRVERRRRDLRGRFARATYPVRSKVGEFIDGLPCNVIGHHWVDISRPAERVRDRKLRFKCSRCNMTAGFTN